MFGKEQTPMQKSVTKGAQMALADIAGNAADVLFLRYQENIDKAIPWLKSGFKKITYLPLKIMQGPIEWTIDHLAPGLEGKEARAQRHQQTEEQRLDGLSDAFYHYSAAGAVGLGTLMISEKMLSQGMQTGHVPNKMWWKLDAPSHLGIALLMGTTFAEPVTSTLKSVIKKSMMALGSKEEKAEQDAVFITAYIVPNYLTLIPTIGMMSSLYHAEAKGLVREVGTQSWVDKYTHGKANKLSGGLLGGDAHNFEMMSHDPASLKDAGFMTRFAKLIRVLGDPTNAKTAVH